MSCTRIDITSCTKKGTRGSQLVYIIIAYWANLNVYYSWIFPVYEYMLYILFYKSFYIKNATILLI